MKNHSKIILFVIIVLSINNICLANPLSNFMSLFQKELILELIYKNHQNLIQGSDVYLAKDHKGQKTSIGEELKEIMDSIGKQNQELLNQLEEYIDTLDTEEFQKKIDDLADQIKQFSKEQKETFKNDVLPALKNMFNLIIEQLEKQDNKEKSKNLEKQLKEIEEKVDV